MGFLWTFINPLCQMIVYMVVFSVIIRSELEQFYVYMITGMVPWLFFDMALRQGACCVRYQGELVKKIYFPREVLPLACVTSNFMNMLFCFLIVFMVLTIRIYIRLRLDVACGIVRARCVPSFLCRCRANG